MTFDELEACLKDKNTHRGECSSLFKSGDPYGNRIEFQDFGNLSDRVKSPYFTRFDSPYLIKIFSKLS